LLALGSVKVNGAEMKYVVYVPPGYTSDKPWPTIVFLNGWGECGSDGLKQIAIGLGYRFSIRALRCSRSEVCCQGAGGKP